MNRLFKLAVSILFAALLLTGCGKVTGQQDGQGQYPMIVQDSTGINVTINKEPEKIVSLSPVISEIICAVGSEDKLKGRTSYCDYPASIKKVAEVGDMLTVNVEKIIGLEPDIVIGSAFMDENVRQQLEAAGITVLSIYSEDGFAGAYKDIETIGRILNHETEANKVVEEMKDKVDEVKSKIAKAKTEPSVYFVVGFGAGGEFTATGDTFISEMIELAGGRNIASDAIQWSFTLEKIVERDPDLLLYSSSLNKEELISATGYRELNSVKNGKVFSVESNLIERTGPRLALGLEALARLIHPELY